MHGSSVLAFSVDGAKIQTKRSVNVSGGFFITFAISLDCVGGGD